MTNFTRYWPAGVFADKDSVVVPILTAPVNLPVGNNRTVVLAVTGKKIKILGWEAQSVAGTAGSLLLKDASGGSTIIQTRFVPIATNGLVDRQPIFEGGYGETTAGNGLYADVATADINMTLYYIAYQP